MTAPALAMTIAAMPSRATSGSPSGRIMAPARAAAAGFKLVSTPNTGGGQTPQGEQVQAVGQRLGHPAQELHPG